MHSPTEELTLPYPQRVWADPTGFQCFFLPLLGTMLPSCTCSTLAVLRLRLHGTSGSCWAHNTFISGEACKRLMGDRRRQQCAIRRDGQAGTSQQFVLSAKALLQRGRGPTSAVAQMSKLKGAGLGRGLLGTLQNRRFYTVSFRVNCKACTLLGCVV